MCSITIADNGTVVYQKAFGYSNIDGAVKTPADVHTKYRIGSITKMFTAVMIFQLIEEGKLTLNTVLAKYYPQLPNAGKITIAEMLRHRSGLHNFTADSLYLSYVSKQMSEMEMTAIFEKQKPDFEPDLKAEYSNTNFVLLGYIIEKITGKSYSEQLRERISDKIGLEDTYYGTKTDPGQNEAYSYNYISEWSKVPETNMSIPAGAGAIIATPTDLIAFINALFEGKLINQVHLEQMKLMKDNFGMAMFVFPFDDKTGYGHSGGIDGFSSQLIYYPADKLSIAYVANGVRYSTNEIIENVLTIYYNKPFTMPEFKTVKLKISDLEKYLGNYTSEKMPLKIAITQKNATLIGQATGQNRYPLEARGNNKFTLDLAEVTLNFDTIKHSFYYFQNGETYLFTRVR